MTRKRKRKEMDMLSPEELVELCELKDDLFEMTESALWFTARLVRARDSSVRGVARDRLLCVIEDCLCPAVRDLNLIGKEALREQINISKRRKNHAGRDTARRSK